MGEATSENPTHLTAHQLADVQRRPLSAYIFTPLVWFENEGKKFSLEIVQATFNEEVASRTIEGFAKVTITRQGWVTFDFHGFPLEKIKTPQPGQDTFIQPYVDLYAERARYMTCHSNCLMTAYARRTLGGWIGGSMVTSVKQILGGGSMNPTSSDTTLRNYCKAVYESGISKPFWELGPFAETEPTKLVADDASRSLELLEHLVSRPQTVLALDLLVRAEVSFREHDFSLSAILAWTMIEMAIDRLWGNYIADKTKLRRNRLSDNRTYSVAVRIEFLVLANLINANLGEELSAVRRARNTYIHSGAPISMNIATTALVTATQLLKIAYEYDAVITPSMVMSM